MREITMVTILVPLSIPLELANNIDREAESSHRSIAEMLSSMLVDAWANEKSENLSQAAASPDLTFDGPSKIAPWDGNGATTFHPPTSTVAPLPESDSPL